MCLSYEELPAYLTAAPYKAVTYVYHVKNYQNIFLMLLIRQVCTFIMRRITSIVSDAPYKAGMYVHNTKDYQSRLLMLLLRLVPMYLQYTKNYYGSLLTLATSKI